MSLVGTRPPTVDEWDASFYRYDIGGDCDCGWHERGQLF